MTQFGSGLDRRNVIKTAPAAALAAWGSSGIWADVALAEPAKARAIPRFSPSPDPAIQVPDGRYLGPVTGLAVAPNGHIWICHLSKQVGWGAPDALWRDEARLPPIVEFDATGKFIQAWGGPDHLPRIDGRPQWHQNEETVSIDDEGAIWVFGSNKAYDHAVQRFSPDGKLLLRIGKFGEAGDDNSEDRLGCPTDAYHDTQRREVYVSDGYVNHRVVVFNSDTGEFLRSFGAYGASPPPSDTGAMAFSNPVHAICRGPDGLLYVSDRMNNRVQVFDALGLSEARFVREIAIPGESQHGTAFNIAFSPDGGFMYVADGDNGLVWIVAMSDWEVVGSFPVAKDKDPNAILHKITTDRKGDLLAARTTWGVFRFTFDGLR